MDSDINTDECGICMETYNIPNIWECSTCHYFVCKACALKLFADDHRCPGCRKDVSKTVIFHQLVENVRRFR